MIFVQWMTLPACEAALDTSTAQEPTGTDETKQGHDSIGPQKSLEESSSTVGSGVLETRSVDDRGGNGRTSNVP